MCCAQVHVLSLPISTLALWVGGQRCNTAIKPMIHGCLDVTKKLSCHLILKQKAWWFQGGGAGNTVVPKLQRCLCNWVVCFLASSLGSEVSIIIDVQWTCLFSAPLRTSLLSVSNLLPNSHICVATELSPGALGVMDSLVKNAVLLDEQTNVPCNVVALAFYATLKVSINLHNSSEHILPFSEGMATHLSPSRQLLLFLIN